MLQQYKDNNQAADANPDPGHAKDQLEISPSEPQPSTSRIGKVDEATGDIRPTVKTELQEEKNKSICDTTGGLNSKATSLKDGMCTAVKTEPEKIQDSSQITPAKRTQPYPDPKQNGAQVCDKGIRDAAPKKLQREK